MSLCHSASPSPVLAVRTRARTGAIPLEYVDEVMRPLPVEPLAGAPPGVCGLAIVRGRAIPVVDLETLLDNGATARTDAARFVTLRVGGRPLALLVEAVLSIRVLALGQFEDLPPLWQGPNPPAVAALGALDRELFIVLEATRLLPEAVEAVGKRDRA